MASPSSSQARLAKEVQFGKIETPVDVPLIRQSTSTNCGLASLAMLLTYFSESPVSLAQLEQTGALLHYDSANRRSRDGYSVGELQALARAYGVSLSTERVTSPKLRRLQYPLLAWIDLGGNGHFTVVQSLSDTKVVLADPTRGYLKLGPATWSRLWLKGPTGIVLYVSGKSP
jgi:ABC-type bacteriocin/lantibiotic exporter with double-glycine peptidase domain